MNDQEKAETGTRTIVEFFQQFGDDVYSVELLTILFEVLMNTPRDILMQGELNEESEFVQGLLDQESPTSEEEHKTDS